MKQLLLTMLLTGLLAGCNTSHIIELKDGKSIVTRDEPYYNSKSGFYEYHNENGQPVSLNKDQVRKIRPAP